LRTGRNHSLVCNRETRHCKLLRNSSSRKMMRFSKLRVRSLESVMRQEKNKRSLKSFMKSSRNANLSKSSLNNEERILKLKRNALMSSTSCSRILSILLKASLLGWKLRRIMLKIRCKSLRNQSCSFTLRPKILETTFSTMLLNRRQSKRVLQI
jgi:hypothetical protein